MYLTVTTRGFWKKKLLLERDGILLATMQAEVKTLRLTLPDGTVHTYAFDTPEGHDGFSVSWQQDGRDIVQMPKVNEQVLATGFVYGGHTYGIQKDAGKTFNLQRDGAHFGTLTRKGWISSRATIETGRDIPPEAAGFLLYMSMILPVLRFL